MSKSGSRRHSRYVHCEPCIFLFWILFCWMSLLISASFIPLCCWFFLCFLYLAWKTSEALIHVHYKASRDIGCTFALNLFVSFPPVWAHWLILRCGFIWFLFYMFFFSSSFLCFSFTTLFWEDKDGEALCQRRLNGRCQWEKQKMGWWWFDYRSAFRGKKLNEIWKWKGNKNLNRWVLGWSDQWKGERKMLSDLYKMSYEILS